MKKIYWTGSLLALTIYTQAQAAVVDQFQCSIQFFDHEGLEGPKTHGTFAAVRKPVVPDPLWVPGVTASRGHLVIGLEVPEIRFEQHIRYTLYSSSAKGKAAQDFCGGHWQEYPKSGWGVGNLCTKIDGYVQLPGMPQPQPYDPTDKYPLTQINDAGTPLFLSSDLKSKNFDLNPSDPDLSPWSRAHTECVFIGTIE